MNNIKIITDILIRRGNKYLQDPPAPNKFTENEIANRYLNDIKYYPHYYALACIMDRQIKAEKAWLIPYQIAEKINNYKFNGLLELSIDDYLNLFHENSLHRFNNAMAKYFYLGVSKIHNEYKDNAALIWTGNVSSATIVRRFLQFEGVGIKIATMATNILVRDFKIPIRDRLCIDISPDVQVKRVFKRIGYINKNASVDDLIYCARELNPTYPGIFDLSAWEIGRKWCRPKNPKCAECYLNNLCPKLLN